MRRFTQTIQRLLAAAGVPARGTHRVMTVPSTELDPDILLRIDVRQQPDGSYLLSVRKRPKQETRLSPLLCPVDHTDPTDTEDNEEATHLRDSRAEQMASLLRRR